jgi:tetratricopeptide (TPR) repeat protein
MRAVNPYIVGNPIKDQSGFFGRQDIFREVMQILRQPGSNAIVLYGQRRIGKTSVLLQLEKQLKQASEFTPVYFDLQDKAAKSLSEVLFELSQHISRVTGHPAAKPTDFDPTGDYFRRVFLPNVAGKVASGGLVLLFDEFDVLDSPMRTQASEAFFPYLRQWMDDIQKIKFVFVIGRRPEDLSVRTMATFKGVQSTRVSFLSMRDARDVVVQSEKDGSLVWEKGAAERVIELTHGHPYFTQLLCSVIWENAHEEGTSETPRVSVQNVEEAVEQSLKFGANAFNWIWDGLPPAERVVVAAMAEVHEERITQDRLIETLNSSGVRLVARELEVAPETLIDWEVLIASDGAYRFAVPLLRRWVIFNRPLRRVKEELDRLNPLAENLYQSGQGFYGANQLEPAEQQLRQALNINPNHLKARLLLGQVLLERGNFSESVAMFDAAYQYDERAARADLIKALLALADTQEENLQLSTYGRILNVQSDQPLANEKIRAIWIQRGEAALAEESFEEALKAFEQIGDTSRIENVRARMHEKRLSLDMQRAENYEKLGQWKQALDILQELTSEYPESETLQARVQTARMNWRTECMQALIVPEQEENWSRVLEICESLELEFPGDADVRARADRAREQQSVALKYQEALGVLESGQKEKARQMLSSVLTQNPGHLHAAHKLIEATYGRVNITRPVTWGAWVPVGVASLNWMLLAVLVASAVVWRWLFRMLSGIAIETLILLTVLMVGVISIGATWYAVRTLQAAFRVDIKNRPTLRNALWMHFPLGMGLFHLDPQARRRWVYPVLAMLVPLILIVGPFLYKVPFDTTKQYTPKALNYYEAGFLRGTVYRASADNEVLEGTWDVVLGLAAGLYVLSFADLLYTYWLKSRRLPAREARARPSPATSSEDVITAEEGTAAHTVLRYDGTNAASAAQDRNPPAELIHEDNSDTSVYVQPTAGIPLYHSLPAVLSSAYWLDGGARLTVIEPWEEALPKLGKLKQYIQVMDSRGNTGYVTATALSLHPPTGDDHTPSAAMVEEPETG